MPLNKPVTPAQKAFMQIGIPPGKGDRVLPDPRTDQPRWPVRLTAEFTTDELARLEAIAQRLLGRKGRDE